MNFKNLKILNKNGVIKTGIRLNGKNILIAKINEKKEMSLREKTINKLFRKIKKKDSSLESTNINNGTVLKTKILKKKDTYSITIEILETKKIQLGDKLSGRHGNKGIISKILPIEDTPYTQDGQILDIIINPLGIPSRMNVGQIFELLLGLAGHYLKENYKIIPFHKDKYKGNVSKRIVYNKLIEARKKTEKNWLFNPNHPGKTKIFNGKNGRTFNQPISIGYSYILKLIHLVDEKINVRLTGPYSIITKQPTKGKNKKGGQRFGEMEIWAIEGFGSAYILQEILTVKSDDKENRLKTLVKLIEGKKLPKPNIPESFKILIIELQSLCLEVNISLIGKRNFFIL